MAPRPLIPEIEAQRHEYATRRQLDARTPAEREYWRGFAYGALRRLIGKVSTDDYDHIAFDLLKDAPDGMVQILARGYQAGFSGEAIDEGPLGQRTGHICFSLTRKMEG